MHIKAKINGVKYDTEKALKIGEGGPQTDWARSDELGGTTRGRGTVALPRDEAHDRKTKAEFGYALEV